MSRSAHSSAAPGRRWTSASRRDWTARTATRWPGGSQATGGQASSAVWWHNFHAWLTDHDVDWCWWALNPTQPKGTIPVANRHRSDWGDPEPWGLLAPDWRGVANPGVLDLLKSMMPPRTGPGII